MDNATNLKRKTTLFDYKNYSKKTKFILVIAIIIVIALIIGMVKYYEIKHDENRYISEAQSIIHEYKLEDVNISMNYERELYGHRVYVLTADIPSFNTLKPVKQYQIAKKIEDIFLIDSDLIVRSSITSHEDEYTFFENTMSKNGMEYLVNGTQPPKVNTASTNTTSNSTTMVNSSSPSYTSTPTEDEKTNAIVIAKYEVKNRLKSPSTADFPWGFEEYSIKKSPDNHFIVSSYVDAENSFGATIRTLYVVEFQMTGNDNYILEDVSIIE